MTKNLILACLAGVILTACGSKNEPESISAAPVSPAAAPATVTAPVTLALPKADTSIPLSQYQKAVPEDMVYLYHALSGLPLDYDKIAQQISMEYRSTTDGFKKKDILAALTPKIDAAIAEVKKSGRYVYLDTILELGHYDMAKKAFPVSNMPTADGGRISMSQSPYQMVLTNGGDYTVLPFTDEAKAREVEAIIAKGIWIGNHFFRESYPTMSRLYLFAQVADSNNQAVKFQVVKVEMKTPEGQAFAER